MAAGEGVVVASVEELLAVAVALETEAARRYRYLAAWWEAQGDRALTALFDRLAHMEQAHLTAVRGRRPGMAIEPLLGAEQHWPPFDDTGWHSALLTPYRALAYAVHEEERAFTFYTEVAAHAPNQAVRGLAEDLARDELEHAAILRQARRAAFHGERLQQHRPPPDLPTLQRQSAAWEAEAAAAISRPTRMFAFSRNVERYLAIAEQMKDEAVLTAAQHLATQALQSLMAMRDGSDAP